MHIITNVQEPALLSLAPVKTLMSCWTLVAQDSWKGPRPAWHYIPSTWLVELQPVSQCSSDLVLLAGKAICQDPSKAQILSAESGREHSALELEQVHPPVLCRGESPLLVRAACFLPAHAAAVGLSLWQAGTAAVRLRKGWRGWRTASCCANDRDVLHVLFLLLNTAAPSTWVGLWCGTAGALQLARLDAAAWQVHWPAASMQSVGPTSQVQGSTRGCDLSLWPESLTLR